MRQSTNFFITNSRVFSVFSGDVLIKIRLWFNSLAFAHLIMLAVKLLLVDFRQAEDPNVWVYEEYKWKLITCWFNLVSLVYMPMCVYCDWRELRREGLLPHVKVLNQIKLVLFTSILLPTTMFADIMFWRLWNKDRNLIAPESVDKLVPFWTQHCMHTVTLLTVLIDLILTPRQRPKSFVPCFIVMGLFLGIYSCVCIHSIYQGQYLYPVLKTLSMSKLLLLQVLAILEHIFYFYVQWIVIDFIWGEKTQLRKNTDDSGKTNDSQPSYISEYGSFLVSTACRVIPILGISKSAAN